VLAQSAGAPDRLRFSLTGAAAGGSGFILGLLTLRVEGHNLALETMALTAIVKAVIAKCDSVTAAALGLPCLVLFGASDPEIWGPWKTPARVLHSPEINAIMPAQAAETLQQLVKEASFSPLQLR